MPRQKPKSSNKGLFGQSIAEKPESFSERLRKKKLISRRSGKLNVEREIDNAFAGIRGLNGISISDLVEALRGKGEVSPEAVLKAAVRPIERSREEKKAIGEAIETIVSLVNRKKRADFFRGKHARRREEYGEMHSQRKHLESIRGK